MNKKDENILNIIIPFHGKSNEILERQILFWEENIHLLNLNKICLFVSKNINFDYKISETLLKNINFKLIDSNETKRIRLVNEALEFMNGKYTIVLDVDDFLFTENIVKLVDFLSKNEFDIITNSFFPLVNINSHIEKNELPKSVHYYNGVEFNITANTIIKTKILKQATNYISDKVEYSLLDDILIYTIVYLQNNNISTEKIDIPVYKHIVYFDGESQNHSGLKNKLSSDFINEIRSAYLIIDFLALNFKSRNDIKRMKLLKKLFLKDLVIWAMANKKEFKNIRSSLIKDGTKNFLFSIMDMKKIKREVLKESWISEGIKKYGK